MLKMNELVKLSQTPKSTILYYVKEGLLPEPHKDKPNFHLYDEKCVKLIEFIRYLQSNFYATISQIKALFASPAFDVDNPYESLISSLSIIMGAESETFSETELCQQFHISAEQLQQWVTQGLITPRDNIFTAKERDILAILCRSNAAELGVIAQYAEVAKKLAVQEAEVTINALENSSEKDQKLKHLFDILLVLKPYVLNMQTLKTYQQESQS
ncbi:MerR family transcriptional regulator [Frederiksenia canicola]